MSARITNIHTADFQRGESERDSQTWRYLDLSGEHLGVRIEETPPGGTTSYHHYHTTEEEHVLVLSGSATLCLGEERIPLNEGDHVWFPAGETVAHHIKNTATVPFRYLVFGERNADDVVFYPKGGVMVVKSAGTARQFNYEPRKTPEE